MMRSIIVALDDRRRDCTRPSPRCSGPCRHPRFACDPATGEHEQRVAVGDRVDGGLLAAEELLDDERRARVAESPSLASPRPRRRSPPCATRRSSTPLPAARPSAFTTTGKTSACSRCSRASAKSVNVRWPRGRHVVAQHHALGEVLAALELCRLRDGPKTRRPSSRKRSTIPATSGASGPTTVRSMASSLGELDQSVDIAGQQVWPALGDRGDASVAWCAVHPIDRRTLGQGRAQSACSRPPPPTTRTFTSDHLRGRLYHAGPRRGIPTQAGTDTALMVRRETER